MTFLALEQLPFRLGAGEWFLVLLASAIIFAILGPRLLRDLRRPR